MISSITIAWSAAAAVCLTLGLIYLFVWLRHRTSLAHLLFSISAFGAGGNALAELAMLRSGAVGPYIQVLKYSHVFIFMLLVGLVWFAYHYFGTARRWLAVAITACWVLILLINFAAPYGTNYSDVSGLRELALPGGERYSLAAGTTSPWRLLADISILAIVVYVIDAAVRARRLGGLRGTISVGVSVTAFFLAAGTHSALVDMGIVNSPYLVTFAFMGIIFVMGLQLSSDVVRASVMSKEIAANERRWRTLLEQVHLLVVGMDPDGTTNYVNPRLLEKTGYRKQDVLGKDWFRLFHPDGESERSRADYEDYIHGGSYPYYRSTIVGKDGSELVVAWSNVRLHDQDGRVIGSLSIGADVTDEVAAFKEIEKLKERLYEENIYLKEEVVLDHDYGHIIYDSDELRYVLSRVSQVAPTDTTVLIEGETGVGKELVARAVHEASPRKDRPLIKVNCAAIPAGLLESELFGYMRGAFTGADRDRKGRFQLADGGTIFLDEIGELPLELQPKLLRVLEEGEFTPLGGTRTLKVDVRVIVTTNRELKRETAAGNFRQDLYHRLSTYPVTIPPLRKRKGDIQPLVEAFVERFARKLGKQINQVPREVVDALCAYPWPGNVRELRNVIERAVIGTNGPVLRLAEDLGQPAAETSQPGGAASNMTLEQAERTHILSVLKKCNWRIEGESGAARRLDINPSTLRNRIKKLRIERPS